MIYLDYAATTPLSQHVKDNIIQNLGTFGNPSSPHKLGLEAYSLIEKARETVAECIGAEPEEIFLLVVQVRVIRGRLKSLQIILAKIIKWQV